jgi:hypothetical protein
MTSADRRSSERRALIKGVVDRMPVEIRRELAVLKEAVPRPAHLFKRFMDSLGSSIGHAFSVQEDEVAVLLVKDQDLLLGFAYPFTFYTDKKNVIPMSTPSIAGEVLRAGKGRVDNNVHQIRHLDMYERIKVKGKTPLKIQKMISAPLLLPEGRPFGVMQVSRKAKSLEEAGPNFTATDLLKLTDLGSWLAPYILKLIPPDF